MAKGVVCAKRAAAPWFAAIFLALLLLSACEPQPLVAVILTGESDPLLLQGLRDAARQSGVRLSVSKPSDARSSEVITQALSKKTAALIFPSAAQNDGALLKEASLTGLPLLCLGACPLEAPKSPFYRLPGPDRDAGYLAGYFVRQLIQDASGAPITLLVLDCAPSPGCAMRLSEFEQTVADAPALAVIHANPAPSLSEVRKLLQTHPAINVVWAAGSAETALALQVLQDLRLASRVKLIGGGVDSSTSARLASGELSATVQVLPYQAGYDALILALSLARAQPFPFTNRKNAALLTVPGDPLIDHLGNEQTYMLPTLAPFPDPGAGIKPGCNCGPPSPATPTPTSEP